MKAPAVHALIVTVLMTGCATARYEPLADAGKNEVVQLNADTFLVEYRVNPFTAQTTLDAFLLKRCAEVTLREGYDFFMTGERSEALTYHRSTSVMLKMFKGQTPSEQSSFIDAKKVLELPAGRE